jgi:hypothetical protein
MNPGSFTLVVLLTCTRPPSPFAGSIDTTQEAGVAVALPGPGETQELTLRDGSRLFGRVVSVEPDRAKVAVGLLHISAGGDDQVGVAYGVTTIGRDDDAVTIGAGYGYETSGGGGAVVVMVGGEHRVSRRLKLVTENYVWEGPSGILSGGVRFIGDHLSADLGLVAPLGGA